MTRPRPAFGRMGLGGLSGGYSSHGEDWEQLVCACETVRSMTTILGSAQLKDRASDHNDTVAIRHGVKKPTKEICKLM